MSQRQETDTGSHTYCLYSKAALDKNTTELAGQSGRFGESVGSVLTENITWYFPNSQLG